MERIEKLKQKLSTWNVGGCLIENPIDLFYLTHLEISAGSLLILPHSFSLFVDGRYWEMVRQSQIPFKKSQELENALKGISSIAFDSQTTSYARYQRLKSYGVNLEPIASPLKELRVKKDLKELSQIKKNGQLTLQGIEYIQSLLKEGISEKELARALEIFCIEKGADKMGFDPIIAFGPNTALPHHRAGDDILKKGDLVLIDVGVARNHYCSDFTRVLFFGKEDPELKEMVLIVKEAYQAALALCRSGTSLFALDQAAKEVIKKGGLEKLLVHSLGHGLGLEVHEFPRINSEGDDKDVFLETGMVITLEPGLYLPGKGGVRYEDTVIIKDDGYELAL